MNKPLALFGFVLVCASFRGLEAQTTAPPTARLIGSCSSGLPGGGPECPLDRRLLIDLRRRGVGAPQELEVAVSMGANVGGAFRLAPQQSTPADSAIYAILVVDRDSSGAYRVEHSITGSRSGTSGNCSGAGNGYLSDLGFGAFLAVTTTQLVQCAQNARARLRTE
jgi:hypothetical protein